MIPTVLIEALGGLALASAMFVSGGWIGYRLGHANADRQAAAVAGAQLQAQRSKFADWSAEYAARESSLKKQLQQQSRATVVWQTRSAHLDHNVKELQLRIKGTTFNGKRVLSDPAFLKLWNAAAEPTTGAGNG